MDKRSRIPWFTLALAIAVAIPVPWLIHDGRWDQTTMASAGVVFFLVWIGKGLKGLGLGLIAAVVVAVHPLFQFNGVPQHAERLAQAGLFGAFAFTLWLWYLLYAAQFDWRNWLAAGLGLSACISLAWVGHKHVGMEAGAAALLSLLVAAHVAFWSGPPGTPKLSLVTAVLVAFIAPALGGAIGYFDKRPLTFESIRPDWQRPDWQVLGLFWKEAMTETFYGFMAAVFVLIGLWQALTRGWKQKKRYGPPTTWGLFIFAGIVFLHTISLALKELTYLKLLPWSILLVAFLILDLIHTIGERMVLAPREEQTNIKFIQG